MRKVMFTVLMVTVVALTLMSAVASADPNSQACWGQASAVFAQTGEMGAHASQEETPRDGLANLARALYDDGQLPDDTIQALGAFVATAYGLSIEACEG